ncbi:poly glycohydrolase family protein [Pelomyxa schiedti]|nr:poly glycohydrolase family protein [Pelomyxa schiedti]
MSSTATAAEPAESNQLSLPIDDDGRWQSEVLANVLRPLCVGTPTLASLDAAMSALPLYDGTRRKLADCTWMVDTAASHPTVFDWAGLERALPALRDLALGMPQLFNVGGPARRPHLLPKNTNGLVTLSRRQVACIMIHSLLGTMQMNPPYYGIFFVRNLFSKGKDFGNVLCVLNYFKRIGLEGCQPGFVLFERRNIAGVQPGWETSSMPLCNVTIQPKTTISSSAAQVHVDFANALIGGGVLIGASCQEEILFATHPEMIVSIALCEELSPGDALIIQGALEYSLSTGYASSFKFTGDAPFSNQQQIPIVAAIDALFAYENDQFDYTNKVRDLNKAYLGFLDSKHGTVATGNWGCGAFGCNVEIKLIQQWMAASQCAGFMDVIARIRASPRHKTVGGLFALLLQFICGDKKLVDYLL